VGAVERGDTAFAAALEQLVLAIMTADRRKPRWTDRTLAERRRVLENRVDAVVAILPLHPDGERLRRWLKAHRDELTLCLRRRDVPATNNASDALSGFRGGRSGQVERNFGGCRRLRRLSPDARWCP
jgi:hypothetical protein